MKSVLSECLNDISEIDNPVYKIYGLTFCAKALQEQEMFEEAIPLIEEAYKLNQDCKIGIIEPDILSVYSNSLAYQGDFIKCFLMFDNLFEIIKLKGIEANLSLHLTLQARSYYKFGINNMPTDLLLKAIHKANISGNFYQEAFAAFSLAEIYLENKNIEEGFLYADHASRITKKINANSLQKRITNLIHKYVANS
jgi:tetratricopeptide (TPR) repeat protein